MSRRDLDYRAISRQVEKKLADRKRRLQIDALIGHVVVFIVTFIAASFLGWMNESVLPLIFMTWLVGLLLHVGSTFISMGRRDSDLREKLLQQAIQDAIVRLGQEDTGDDYPARMGLSDDGELVELDEQYLEAEKPKREEF